MAEAGVLFEGDSAYAHYRIADVSYMGRPARLLYGGTHEAAQSGLALDDRPELLFDYNQRLLELYPNSAPAIAVGAKLEDVLRYGAEHGEFPAVRDAKDIDTFVNDWINCFKRREPFVGEEMFADGRWVLVSHRPTSDGGFVSIRSDITAQKNREIDLQAAKTELEGLTESLIATLEEPDAPV